jgi:hypothetical protein
MNTIGTMGHLLKREENTGERLSLLEEEKTTLPLKTSRGKISSLILDEKRWIHLRVISRRVRFERFFVE